MLYDRYMFLMYVCLVIDGIWLVEGVGDYINNLFGYLFINHLIDVCLMLIVCDFIICCCVLLNIEWAIRACLGVLECSVTILTCMIIYSLLGIL